MAFHGGAVALGTLRVTQTCWHAFLAPAMPMLRVSICIHHSGRPPSQPQSFWQPESMESCAGWEHLPAELLTYITGYSIDSIEGLAAVQTRCRLVCRGWRQALPLGERSANHVVLRSAKLE